jgi:hypothetical protein
VIPAGESHRILWQRRADLINIYLSSELLCDYSRTALHQDRFELQPHHSTRDVLIEELGRALHLESESGNLDPQFAKSAHTKDIPSARAGTFGAAQS